MRLMRRYLIYPLLLCLLAGIEVHADSGCDEVRDEVTTLSGEFLGNAWRNKELPEKGDVIDALTQLDEDGVPWVQAIDLNGDGQPELMLTSSGERLCGTAGCPYELLAPRTYKRIGQFFGHLAILDERINGYRIFQNYSKHMGSATRLDTYVFDRGAYRLVAHVILDGCGFDLWRRQIRMLGKP